MAQVVECLPCKCEILSSNTSIVKKKKIVMGTVVSELKLLLDTCVKKALPYPTIHLCCFGTPQQAQPQWMG
jgi:hypothetical protein